MLESLSCPSCFTHYGLRPERVRPGLRRARCLRCEGIFDIEEAVQRLLAPAAPSLAETSATETLEGINPEDLLELDGAVMAEPAPTLESPGELSLDDSALTLGDLESTEDEILEKTLVIEPSPASELAPSNEEMTDGGGFSSAKDAIAKLLGEGPAPSPDRRNSGKGGSMDVEATLDALEHTLGGTPTKDLSGRPSMPSIEFPTPAALGSTVRLSSSELQAAMAAGASGGGPASEAPTVAIPSLASTRPAFAAQQPLPAGSVGTPSGDPNLLKVQVGQDTYQNVTLEHLSTWIEQGRVQDWHMVARQHSENWIEAGKVPSLRPVFERVRRMSAQTNAGPTLDAPGGLDPAPVKKGLFGWMSNRS